jgi:hypothetical protein
MRLGLVRKVGKDQACFFAPARPVCDRRAAFIMNDLTTLLRVRDDLVLRISWCGNILSPQRK